MTGWLETGEGGSGMSALSEFEHGATTGIGGKSSRNLFGKRRWRFGRPETRYVGGDGDLDSRS
jgi:hypothetical protein